MKLPVSPRRPVVRLALALGAALLAGILLTGSIALSAGTAHPLAAAAASQPEASPETPASRPQAVQPAPRASETHAQTGSTRLALADAFSDADEASPTEAVRRAWQRAKDLGIYHFTTDLAQLLYPAPSIANAGSTPQREELHLEGDVDLAAQAMTMRLWQNGGSILGPGGEVEMRVEDGKAHMRRSAGGAWQETTDLSSTFAPNSDALAFLSGIKDVVEVPANDQAVAALAFRRYGFDIDGPALARYLRDRLEEQLMAQGKLPQGVTLETPQQYRDATGHGELWVSAAGLPLRLTVHLAYPQTRSGTHVEADIKTDFAGFPTQQASAPSLFDQPVSWAVSVANPAQHPHEWAAAGRLLFTAALGFAALALLVFPRRRRKLYAAVVVTVIMSMVITPLLHSERVAAFSQELAARQAAHEEQEQVREAADQVRAELAGPVFDPHRDPLAAPPAQAAPVVQAAPGASAGGQASEIQPGSVASPQFILNPPEIPDCTGYDRGDIDNDGLNNYEECMRGLGTTLDTCDEDTDDDELLDGIEVYQLGTDVTLPDTDGDWITDTLEVRGYPLGDNTWYLNPLQADTDGDGLPDSVECPELLSVDPANMGAFTISTCDTDHDGVPDPWDLDSDNDRVPDSHDLSPAIWIDQDGYHPTAAEDGSITAFAAPAVPPGTVDPRFAFTIQELQTARPWPVLVDLQLRPVNGGHLNFALSVLDWPHTIVDGQIQHVKRTTFADLPEVHITDDEAAAHGDMRLVPMLEVEMNGSAVPLALAPASATVQVGTGTLSTTITLELASATTTKATITPSGPKPTVKIKDSCLSTDAAVEPSPTETDVFLGRLVDVADGDHVIEVSDASASACAEIPNVLNGPYTDKMVDLSVLEPYGISVQELGSSSTTLLMYVPLNLVTDDTGGGRTAFAAHMVYYPGATAIPAQYARVVWAVQAITDSCDTSAEDFPKNLEEYQDLIGDDDAKQEDYDAYYRWYCLDRDHRTADVPQVVQTYDESWYLTGMSIREDHGLVVAAAYENPATHSSYLVPEEDLWQLSLGLSGSFLPQRDCEKPNGAPPVTYDEGNAPSYDPTAGTCSDDGLRDLTVAKKDPLDATDAGNSTIAERFDAATDQNFYFSDADNFGNPLDSLRVQTEKYAYQDRIIDVATRQTAPILNALKDQYRTSDAPNPTFTPTILYAREEYFRSASLEDGSFQSRLLTISVSGTEQLLTALNWETFRYNSGTDPLTGSVIGWEGVPLSEGWSNLQDQFEVYFENLYHPATEEEKQANAGRVKIALSYYLAMTQGLVNMADPCPGLACEIQPAGNSSGDLAKGLQAVVKGVANVVRVAIEEMMAWTARGGVFVKELEMLTILQGGIKSGIGPLGIFGQKGMGKALGWTAAAAGLVVAGGLACLIIMMVSAAKNGDTMKVLADVMLATGLVFTGLGVITAVGRLVRAAAQDGWSAVGKALLTWKVNLKASWELSKCLTTAVAIAMNFLVFMMQWGSGMAVGSLGWDSALAGAIAGSLAAILMFVIFNALGGIGTLVQACLALIDMLVGFICTVTDAYEKQEEKDQLYAKWFCGGVTGLVTNFIKMLIYSGNVIVDMSAENRLQFSNWNYTLVHPEKGMVVGNAIKISVNITDTVTKAEIPPDSAWANLWSGQWNDDNIKKSDFRYAWKDYDWATVDAKYDAASALWQPTTTAHAFERTQPANSSQGFPLNSAGIRSPKAYLIEGYAVPEQECWGVIVPAGGCWVHENTGSSAYDIGSSIVFAVLPATLDGFRTLAAKGRGYAQSWGNITFPVLYDADNDGLPFSSDGDDHAADRDADGLLDGYEIEIGSNPAAADSDSDGLGDRFEILAGTDPMLRDTDGDGLTDTEEVGHQDIYDTDQDGNTTEWLGGWDFVYMLDKTTGAPSRTWVWPDPLSVDGDGDTLSDAQERVYGYHPRVESSLNILILDSQLKERDKATGLYVPSDGMVYPGQSLDYVSTVTNQLLSREAEGLLSTETGAGISTVQVPDRSFVLRPQEQSTTSGYLSVSGVVDGGVYTVTQVAGGTISDWTSTAGGMVLWLPFNDPNAPFFDRSGNLPPHDGICFSRSGETPWAGCRLDANGYYGNGLSLDGASYLESAAQPPQLGGSVSLWFRTTSTGKHDLVTTPIGTGAYPLQILIDGGVLTSTMGATSTVSSGPATSPGYADGEWHHVVVTYGKESPASTSDVHRFYVDGQLKGAGTAIQLYAPASNGIDLGGRMSLETTSSPWLPGMLDDVRIYDHRLSQRQVAELYGKVAFSMNFNLANPWQETSGQDATVGCASGYCPSVSSGAARFDGAQYLAASGAIPNLSGGRLTLSAWLYPTFRGGGDPRDTWYQGILGFHSQRGDATASPTLERYGLKLRFGFSTGTAWRGFTTASNVLTQNAWNHIVATYSQDDGYARIYVNGVEKGNSNVGKYTSIASPASFDIGRTTDVSTLKITHVDVLETADALADCPEYYPPADNLCVALNGVEWFHEAVGCWGGDWNYNTSYTLNGTSSATLTMWENDGGVNCGPVCDKDDDCGGMLPNVFSWTDAGAGAIDSGYEVSGGSGVFRMNFSNASIPFYGYMDDVQIYNRSLTAAEVEALYQPPSVALHLPFDEPPGTAAFTQSGGATVQASCTSCPTAGEPGRIDQALAFDGTSDYLSMPNSPLNRLTSGFTVAAWVRADSVSSDHTIVATSRLASDDGYGFGISNGKLRFVMHPEHYYTPASLTLQAGRWHHVVAAVSTSGSVDFYLDGQQEIVAGSSIIQADAYDELLVGARRPPRSTGLDQYFDGKIDDLQIHDWYLSADQVKNLIDQAPVMHMRLDEPQDATQFADSAHTNVSAGCPTAEECPMAGAAIQGKVGLAAHFDGENDNLVLDDPGLVLRPDKFTVGGWVKPSGLKPTHQPVLANAVSNGRAFYILRLQAVTGVPELLRGCPPYDTVAAPVPLVENQWNQVLGTYDGQTLRLYVNGLEVRSLASAAGTCTIPTTSSLSIGTGLDPTNKLAGTLDELILYNHALAADEIAALYAYQLSWTEDRESDSFTIDRDNPKASFLLNGTPYYPNAPVVIPIGASDATSGVASAELCEGSSCGGPAPHCQDPGQTTAWCPTFTPSGEGVFYLSAKVTDRVGYIVTSAAREVRIDDTPPLVSFSGSAGDVLAAVRDSNNNWTVRLSGTATDPALASTSMPGSGVPLDGVHVTLYKADGGLAGAAAQAATLTGGTWTVDYVLSDSEPIGCYTAEAVAVDALAAIYPDEAANHTSTAEQIFSSSTVGPAAQIDRSFLTVGQSLTSTLAGAVSSNFLPVALSWATGPGGAQAGLTLTCYGPGSADWKYTAFRPGSALDPDQDYTWAGQVHRQATCDLVLTAPAGSPGIISGSATVCGEEVASWSDNLAESTTISFTASSSKCAPDLCAGKSFKPAVGKVEIAFTSLMPGPQFINETPPAGEVLHLTMDSGLDGSGNPVFLDVSGTGLTGTCSGAACPVTGQQGHSGQSAQFDGVDDHLTVPDDDAIDFDAGHDFTVAAWIRPDAIQPTATNIDSDIIEKWSQAGGYPYVIRYLNQGAGTEAGKISVARYDGSHNPGIRSTKLVNDGGFHHVAFVRTAGTLKLYIDGVQDGETADTTSGATTNNSALFIGRRGSGINHFAGSIEDVRIFDHGLTAAEVKELLYTGFGPVLVLPFEKQWAVDGSEQEDTSGWERNAVLYAGSGDAANKSVPGQVASYGLQFDGVDDHAVVPDDDAIDFDAGHDFTVAAWIKPDPAQVWTATVDNNVIEKWSGAGGYPYSIRYLNQTAGSNAGKISAGRWDGQNGPWLQSTTRIDDGRFHHVAFVKRGSMLAFYVDGALDGERTDTTTGATANTSPLYIGRRGGTALQGYFTGSLDDVRIYGRGLPAEEVQELYVAGWRATNLSAGSDNSSARWSAPVPAGLEGAYRVDLRATSSAGHGKAAPVWNTAGLSSPTWSGNVDNLGPRVTVCKELVSGSTYRYVAMAQDYNLSETGFTFICPITGRSTYQSPWFLTAIPAGTEKLYQLTAGCESGTSATVQATACDTSNNCTTAQAQDAALGGACVAIMATAAAGAAALPAEGGHIGPPQPLGPQVEGGHVGPPQPGGPQVKGGHAGPPQPAAEEAAANGTDAAGAELAAGKPSMPVVVFASTVLTGTQYHDPQMVIVEGEASGILGVIGVDLAVDGKVIPAILSEPAAGWPFTRTWASTYLLPPGPLPDGVVQPAVAIADLGDGRIESVQANLTLDVVPPAAVDLALWADGGRVEPNAIVRTAAPELTLEWTASQDGSGLMGYTTRWTATSATATTVTTRHFDPAGPLVDRYVGGEAQILTVELGSRDRYGNERWQQIGPITLDSPETPDIIAADVHVWQESGCTLMGTDRRLYRLGLTETPQQLYATWDRNALRLAFTGASGHLTGGDLFVYLDTGPGGATQPYVPLELPLLGATVTLPASLQADVVIWAQTADQATLLRWDGGAWSGATPLTAQQFHFDGGRFGGQVDIYLPFELLGVTPTSSLGLIGLGVQDPVEGEAPYLRVTLPPYNPVNSPLVSRLAGMATGDLQFSLLQEYRWPALADGVCPNGTDGSPEATREGDSNLQVSIEAEPQGAAFGGQSDGLFWVTDPEDAALPDEESLALRLLQPRNPPVPDGQPLEYTVHYHNAGSDPAVGAYVTLAGYGHISGLPEMLDLGDVPPGGTGEATFQAVVDRSQGTLPVAGVLARIYDASHGPDGPPLDWLSVVHRVDRGAPEAPQLVLPSRIGPLREIFRGKVLDESGIREVTLDVQWSGGSRLITCPLTRPADGEWACDWHAGDPLPHGTPLTVRVQATDSHGQTSPWSAPHTITIDAEPPTTTLDLAASLAAGQGLAVRGGLTLYGTAIDAGSVTAVTVCLQDVPAPGEETCKRAEQQPYGGWSYRAPALGALDAVSRTVTIWATDDLGNRSGAPLTQEILIDNVAPVLAVEQLATTLVSGQTQAVLSGSATDGGPTVNVSVRVQPPAGDEFRADTLQTGNDWSFDLAATEPGRYQLWVEADDQAGNRASEGPFVVDVTCLDAIPVVLALAAEPSPTAPLSVTLSARLTNVGAEPLPAGLPLTFYARGAAVATLATADSLAPGGVLDLAFDWSPVLEGDWPVVTVLNEGQRTLGDAVLCSVPAAAHFTVDLADVPLYTAWNLVSPPVQPDNPDVEIVLRPVQGGYAAILGYEAGPQWYVPPGPDPGSLALVEAGRGYWIRATLPPPPPDLEEPWQVLPAATLRFTGQRLPADQPLSLAEGWNLVGYLPETSLPVTEALRSIDAAVGAVLGFDRTGVSYYPDLADGYNTLAGLRPSAGYWISATQAITLQYPITTGLALTRTARLTGTLSPGERLDLVRAAEQAAGVQPTYTWANLYGQVFLPDGSPAPISTTLTALANGVPCGATFVTHPGRFGLLACYGDDATTPAVDGARPGDAITLLLDGAPAGLQGLRFNGQPVPAGQAVTWTALGDRWEVAAGPVPDVDLRISKTVLPAVAMPGSAITYTLVYSNAGADLATGVLITDTLPVQILAPSYEFTGAAITPVAGAPDFAWSVADLAGGESGQIVIRGTVDPALTTPLTITNVVTITAPWDAPDGSVARVELRVVEEIGPLAPRLWLPLVTR